jgi:DNA-binding response OmpR family regulator
MEPLTTGIEPLGEAILVVEDDTATRRFLADNLTADGYELLEAGSLAAVRKLFRRRAPNLIVLDLTLPDGDGLELIRELRGENRAAARVDPDLPLLVLSGRAGELDRLRAFDRGCDDYLTKPFSYAELLARVRALLRRSARIPRAGRLRLGSLEIDPLSRQVRVAGQLVALSRKEFALLRTLAAEPTRVFTREELLREVWGFRAMCPTRTVDSHVHRLRAKICRGPDKYLINVWGVGYRLLDGDAHG